MRVLCLHDADSNAIELKTTLKSLGDRLYTRHEIDLLYVNAPLTINNNGSDGNNNDACSSRCWFQNYCKVVSTDKNLDTGSNNNTVINQSDTAPQQQYLGLDASILLLKQICNTSPAIDGILGVGQGAKMAAMMALMVPIQFCIFINSHESLFDAYNEPLTNIPCLHVKTMVENTTTALFQQQFPGKLVHCKSKASTWNAIGAFLVQVKQSRNDAQIAKLQSAIATLEIQAQVYMATQVANNPPSSLMAMFTPQGIGGWSQKDGKLSRDGAPCPVEFTLPQHKRGVAATTTTTIPGDGDADNVNAL